MLSNKNQKMIETLQSQLKLGTKQKLLKQRNVHQLLETERLLNEEIIITTDEMDFFSEQLKDTIKQISQTRNQISIIEICSSSERAKINTHLQYLDDHKRGYDDAHENDRKIIEQRNKEVKAKLDVLEESKRLKRKQIEEQNEQLTRDANKIQRDCDEIEKECVILKKRNNAIMLKLRRQLIQTEETRKKLMKTLEK